MAKAKSRGRAWDPKGCDGQDQTHGEGWCPITVADRGL